MSAAGDRYELRARYASRFNVCDGGRYVNDWTGAVDDLLAALARLEAVVECLAPYLPLVEDHHGSSWPYTPLAQSLRALDEEPRG